MNWSKIIAPMLILAVCSFACAANANLRQEPIKVTAEVVKFEDGVMWEHYADGGFQAHDAYTFKIVAPAGVAGKTMRVLAGLEVEREKVHLYRVGTRCTFQIMPKDLTKKTCYWGALMDFQLLPAKKK